MLGSRLPAALAATRLRSAACRASFALVLALATLYACMPDDEQSADQRVPAAASQAGAPAAESAVLHLLRIESVSDSDGPLQTRWGDLAVKPSKDSASRYDILWSGAVVAAMPARSFVLARRAEFTDRDVVVGFANCPEDVAVCSYWQPVWIVLRPNTRPLVLRYGNLFSGGRRAEVSADDTGVNVELGLWDGAHRSAKLTPRNEVRLASRPGEPGRADRATCRAVADALEYCTLARRCDSFEASSSAVPPGTRRALSQLFHTTTGIDAQQFVLFCNTSCRLGFTPSRRMIARDVCRGALPLQWARGDLGWLSREVYTGRSS